MRSITTKYGILLFIILSMFFLTMNALNLSHQLYLRIFNGVIHLFILSIAIYQYRKQNQETLGNYLSGVIVGLYTSVIGSVLFGLFLAGFLYFDMPFREFLSTYIPLSDGIIPVAAAMFIIMEGIAMGLVGSYLITRIVNMIMLKSKTGYINRNRKYAQSAELNEPIKS